ncbi:MAG: lytic transglycosylase domain-containing protein [Pseudanabaena sp. RU_4_16]|nr:lytic transglycosylase domain-containing protein [Pseudanabaena sp. RU_4_16]
MGLIRQESRFEAEILSRSGAVGLMQIMPDTGRWIASKKADRTIHSKIPRTISSLAPGILTIHIGSLMIIPCWRSLAIMRDLVRSADGSRVAVSAIQTSLWREFPTMKPEDTYIAYSVTTGITSSCTHPKLGKELPNWSPRRLQHQAGPREQISSPTQTGVCNAYPSN